MPDWLTSITWDELTRSWVFVPLKIVVVVVIAALLRWGLHRLINRAVRQTILRRPRRRTHLHSEQAAGDAAAGHGDHLERRGQRIRALGSLARSTVTVVMLLVGIVMVLGALGLNVTPVVASTTVIGLTVGFGLQNLIKDLIGGVFMLVDDQIGVGDFVEMAESSGGASGTVEAVGFRVTQLRDDNGTVWYVRNGEVLRVGNYSQGGLGRPPVTRELKPISVRPRGRRLL